MKRFAFIVHLRDINDIAHTIPVPNFLITKIFKKPILWLMRNLKGRAGFIVRSRFSVGENVEGHIIVIWLTGKQIISGNSFTRKRIKEAVIYAQDQLDCDVIGLGALTASVTRSGKWIASQKEINTTITHGDSYAVAMAIEGINRIVERQNINLADCKMAIVGASGIIGSPLSQYFTSRCKEVIAIARRRRKLERMALKCKGKVTIETDLNRVQEADIVVTATSAPRAIIGSENLKKGAVVYEVAQPRNVPEIVKDKREDVLIVDGAYVKVPENIKFWWMSLPPQKTFGCMAETMLLALEGLEVNKVGKINLDFVKKIKKIGEKHGFGHAELTSFNEKI